MADQRPLRGVRVLDLSTVVAGPFSTMILSDLGAEVIKVERIDGGDDSRGMGPHLGGWGAMFVPLNRGKQSIAINVTKPAGREAVLTLASECDVYVENFRGGKAVQLGLDETAVRARAPNIVYASMSAFGTTGPDVLKPGYDGLIQGRTGIMSITGADSNATARAGVSLIDMSAGMWLAMGVLSALYERKQSGRGQRVDASLLQSGIMLMAYHLLYRQFAGENPVPQGSGHSSFAPYGAFHTADGKIMIGVSNDRVYKRFCAAMQRPEWASDPRFVTNVLRAQNRPALDSLDPDALSHRGRRPLDRALRQARRAGEPDSDRRAGPRRSAGGGVGPVAAGRSAWRRARVGDDPAAAVFAVGECAGDWRPAAAARRARTRYPSTRRIHGYADRGAAGGGSVRRGRAA